MKNNAMKLLMVAWAVLIAFLYGCDAGNLEDVRVSAQNRLERIAGGGVITLEKKSAHRSCVLKIGG